MSLPEAKLLTYKSYINHSKFVPLYVIEHLHNTFASLVLCVEQF